MRIAFVIIGYHPTIGGYGRHVKLVSDELRRRGHEVTILTTNFSPGLVEAESGVIRFKHDPLFKITPSLFSHLLHNDYDLVHVFGYQSFQPSITALAKCFKKFPLVFTPHYHPFGHKPMSLRKLFDVTFGNYSLSHADYVVTTTDYEMRLLRHRANHIKVIPNPLEVDKLKKLKGFKRKYGLKGDFVLFVGRIEQDKGLQYLIPAVKGLDTTLVVIGNDAGFKAELPVQGNVLFTGPLSQDDLMRAYNECAFLVLPSRYESFGLVLIEAMHYSKPVIASRVGPVPSIVKDTGLVVPYGDVNGLRLAVTKLLSDKKLRQSMGRYAYRNSLVYGVDNVVDKLLMIYNKVIE
ncbi:MAG: glycosyltransferase family 4 protein [Candidatus Nanoarchaeia archaeon]|jgi:glycosyltransferase involved in cell wall biosynthesis